MAATDRDLLRQKMRGWVEAETTCNELRATQGAPSPAIAVSDALDLWDLRPDLFDLPRTDVEVAEFAAVAGAWDRLRAHWTA